MTRASSPPLSSGIRVALITAAGALGELRAEWDLLWRSAGGSPFQSPHWLLAWWDAFGTAEPVLAAARDGAGRLLGVLPLYILDGPTRKLLPIGAGVTDYQDLLLAPDADPAIAAALLTAALGHAAVRGIARCDLTDLPPEAVLRQVPAPAGWDAALQPSDSTPVLALPDTVAGLGEALPWKLRRNLNLARNRAARIGGCRVETATAGTATEMLQTLFALHRAHWTARGEPGGVLADPRVAALHETAVPALLGLGAARLIALRFGARRAAVYYLLLTPARLMFYLGGFDAAFAAQSPGTLLMLAAVEQAVSEGRREVHFLRGGEAYKYHWGARDRWNATRHLLPPA